MDLWQIVREFGLPLAMLAFVIGAIASGTYVAGRELRDRKAEWQERRDEQEKDFNERLAYTEARRQEERDGRLKAEHALVTLTTATGSALKEMMDLLSDIEKEVIRGGSARTPRGR